jgi:hypothetical protein
VEIEILPLAVVRYRLLRWKDIEQDVLVATGTLHKLGATSARIRTAKVMVR